MTFFGGTSSAGNLSGFGLAPRDAAYTNFLASDSAVFDTLYVGNLNANTQTVRNRLNIPTTTQNPPTQTNVAPGSLLWNPIVRKLFVFTGITWLEVCLEPCQCDEPITPNNCIVNNTQATFVCVENNNQILFQLNGASIGTVTNNNFTINHDFTIQSGNTLTLPDQSITSNFLTNTGVIAGTYGSENEIPQLTVGADGRISDVTLKDVNLFLDPGSASSTDNAIVRFDGTSGLYIQNSPVTLDDSGVLTGVTNITNNVGDITLTPGGSGVVQINGDLNVNGTYTTLVLETLSVSNNSLYLNAGNTLTSPLPGYIVANYLATSTSALVDTGGFTAGGGSGPTVVTDNSAIFAAGDIIQITDANTADNNGFYEVDAYNNVSGLLTIRGIGGTSPTFGFFQNNFTTDATVAGTITKINVAVLSTGTDGIWQSNTPGSSTNSMTFSSLVTSVSSSGAGTASLVQTSTGPTVVLKELSAGSGVTLDTSNPAKVTINSVGTGTNITLASTGAGTSLVSDGSGPTLAIKDLIAGTGMTLDTVTTPGAITLISTGGAGAGNTANIQYVVNFATNNSNLYYKLSLMQQSISGNSNPPSGTTFSGNYKMSASATIVRLRMWESTGLTVQSSGTQNQCWVCVNDTTSSMTCSYSCNGIAPTYAETTSNPVSVVAGDRVYVVFRAGHINSAARFMFEILLSYT